METEQHDSGQGDFDSSLRAEFDRQRQNEEETGNTSIRSPEMEMMPSENCLIRIADELDISRGCSSCFMPSQNIQDLVFCRGCANKFHPGCWPNYGAHKASEFRKRPCQGFSNLDVHLWTASLHASKSDRNDLVKAFVKDRSHRWIGLPDALDNSDPIPQLLLYSALTKQFTNANTVLIRRLPRRQYPRLVSFFGDTGMGKSSIVKNLIRNLTSSDLFETPIVGTASESHMSISGGVHVYPDPGTFASSRPLLYIDSEGLRGDSVPLANQCLVSARPSSPELSARSSGARAAIHNKISRLANTVVPGSSQAPDQTRRAEPQLVPISRMPLRWAECENLPKPWTSTVVEKIYPRFLYVFSDIVCYVTSNSRAAEEDMTRLVDWAHDAFDFTTNQGVKPGLIYIINQDTHADFTKWVDVTYATERIMEKLRKSRRFELEQVLWRERGFVVDTPDQLLGCYYNSVKVVFIPQFKPDQPTCEATAMKQQYHTLYDKINQLSWASSEKRHSSNILFDLEALSRHTTGILEQLSENYESSVDLRKLAEPRQAYPNNFKTHVLNLLSRLQKRLPNDRNTNHPQVNSEISLVRTHLNYIANCIAGEVARAPSDHGSRQEQLGQYMQEWRETLEEFSMTHCRCEKMSFGARCENYGALHVKGHQFNLRGPQRVRYGAFRSSFPTEINLLCEQLSDCLLPLLSSPNRYNWGRSMWEVSKRFSIDTIFSNRTCLTCLLRTPTNLLPCGHLICENCALNLHNGGADDDSILTLPRCPLGCQWTVEQWSIRRKPLEAGVRILSLDGGGVRGIIELAILRAIMEKVGHGIPVQELFDLVVGTSTGGIIALGIFKMGWSVSQATQNFESLVKQAFSKRTGLVPLLRIPGGHFTAQVICTHLYKSSGIEEALQSAFSNQSKLFGDSTSLPETSKVIVVATGEEEEKPFLLTNYNREWRFNDDENNNLRREETPEDELKIWEAARCTSAAPTYFQPYRHPATERIYIDGAMEKNNPVSIADSERKFIWPGKIHNSRDIVVSIGAGFSSDFEGMPTTKKPNSRFMKPFEGVGFVAKLAMLRLVLENTTNCQKMWSDFKHRLGPDTPLLKKCHRVNVPYGDGKQLCRLDAVDEMASIKEEALAFLDGRSHAVGIDVQKKAAMKIKLIARQLVASLFYFQLSSLESFNDQEFWCHGLLRCRLNLSCVVQMRSLLQAKPIFRMYEAAGTDYYTVEEDREGWNQRNFSVPAKFRMGKLAPEIRIVVSLDNGKNWDDISDFPRDIRKPMTRAGTADPTSPT